MEPIVVKPCTVADVEHAPNIADLLAEYGAECAIAGLGAPEAQFETYRAMEQSGAFHLLGAYQRGTLIGFVIFIVAALPHYGTTIATTESFFVARAKRKSGAGMQLLSAAERVAKECGAKGLFVTAPVASRLALILPEVGYRETNRIFFRGLE